MNLVGLPEKQAVRVLTYAVSFNLSAQMLVADAALTTYRELEGAILQMESYKSLFAISVNSFYWYFSMYWQALIYSL